ncbi:hypothetical protein CAPTEDRAFT_187677 [Capitella teleta]|uniref:Mab-21-like HhH/H2TH-like domain-containing protein n=1 Tax=Capitella teleta TaxID=283909 RepID=R7UES7_CAPTE|nr:hypothetical protein CAPTEDRAFT_187677 [Capitella teleta]|eukprot:ELU02298.1 hypothetical protein CAPTEDRAFT_187677 [Capitella teleta]
MNYDKFTELMKQETNESDIDTIYTSLLKSPVLGSMNYQAKCFQEEAKLVRDEVFRLINCFSEDFGHRYPLFAFTPKLRGSMAEGTKSGPPDEFDFMLQMNALSDHCGVTAIAECKAHMTFERLADTHPLMSLFLIFLQYNGGVIHSDLHPEQIIETIFISLKEYFLKLSKLEDSHLSFLCCEIMKVGVFLKLIYNGPLYKQLHISVDLIPCIPLNIPAPITKHIDWPVPLDFSECQLYGLLRRGSDGFDISCTDYEEVLFHSLSLETATEAYVLGKAIGSNHFEWCGRRFGGIFRPSYVMKKALLIAFQQHKDTREVSRHEWIKRIISVRSKLEEIVKNNDGHRCILHVDKWAPGEALRLNLSF